MRILITGANGYIGSKVVKTLCDFGVHVIASDLNDENIDSRAEFIPADIFNTDQNWFTFFKKPDVCLHLAWRDGFVHNSERHMGDLDKHFAFMQNLINNGLKHIACMGTMHEVGYHEGEVDENTPCNPVTPYATAKNILREKLEKFAKEKGVTFQWLRGFYIYGDDLHGNSIFCKLQQAAKEGQKTFPFTSGTNKYDFIHIDDLAKQIAQCIMQEKVSGIINCCSGKPVALGEQIEWYIKVNDLGIKLDYGKYPDREYDSPCIYGNVDKINQVVESFRNEKILVTGVKGQLGYDVVKELTKRGYKNVLGIDKDELDITQRDKVLEFIRNYKPNVVIHNAAWTAVDKAEEFKDLVYQVNSLGPKYISEACKEAGAKMVYISTDYVFDGLGTKPFEVDSPKCGLSIYGSTKSQGEDFICSNIDSYFIIRTSWVFGLNGNNFVRTMLKLAAAGKTQLSVVNDQIGSVTYTPDLASLMCDMIETDRYGVYHATNEGFISWAEFAEAIFSSVGANVKVNKVTTEEYKKLVPNQANRPLNSRLSKESLDKNNFDRLPKWQNALERYIAQLKENHII